MSIDTVLRKDLMMQNVETYQRHTVQIKLPDEVFAALRSYAQKNEHSMNKQINILLRDFFKEQAQREKSA